MGGNFGNDRCFEIRLFIKALVDDDVSDIAHDVVSLTVLLGNIKEFFVLINEFGCAFAGFKNRVLKHIDQKVLIGFNTVDGRFFEGAKRLSARIFKTPAESRTFNQQAVIIRRDD